jgi:hypothetical protein
VHGYVHVDFGLGKTATDPFRRGIQPSAVSIADGAKRMPRFFFDLFFDRYVVLDPGGMLFEYPTSAAAAADEMARHLLLARSELRNSGSWIRVRDERRKEVCRSAIDPDAAGASPV